MPRSSLQAPRLCKHSYGVAIAPQLVGEAVPLLSSINANAARLNTLTAKISAIEEEADDVYIKGSRRFFLANRGNGHEPGQGSAMAYIVGPEVRSPAENVARFDDTSNEIDSIVIDQL